jgi:hypothetical protein
MFSYKSAKQLSRWVHVTPPGFCLRPVSEADAEGLGTTIMTAEGTVGAPTCCLCGVHVGQHHVH